MITITDAKFKLLQETKLFHYPDIIKDIRSSMVPTKRLLDKSGYPLPVEHCWALRSYAYALGITYAEEFKAESYSAWIDNYYPGFTMNDIFSYHKTDYFNMIELIQKDLQNLEIGYRKIPLDGDVSLSKDEYLVKVFILKYFESNEDFHFIRYNPKANIWFHKMSDEQPSIIEKKHNVEFETTKRGDEPKYFYPTNYYPMPRYEPVVYFALKEP